MNQQLKHIFDESVCLTRRQIKDYISDTMSAEECHAAEHHINGCPFCSEAVDGMLGNTAEAVVAVNELDARFLAAHFDRHTPQVHLNSLAPAAQPVDYHHTKTKAQKEKAAIALRNTSIAVVILLGIGLAAYWKFERDRAPQAITTQQTAPATRSTASQTVNQPTAAMPMPVKPAKVVAGFPKQTPPETKNSNDKQQKLHPLILTSKKIAGNKTKVIAADTMQTDTIPNKTGLPKQGN